MHDINIHNLTSNIGLCSERFCPLRISNQNQMLPSASVIHTHTHPNTCLHTPKVVEKKKKKLLHIYPRQTTDLPEDSEFSTTPLSITCKSIFLGAAARSIATRPRTGFIITFVDLQRCTHPSCSISHHTREKLHLLKETNGEGEQMQEYRSTSL